MEQQAQILKLVNLTKNHNIVMITKQLLVYSRYCNSKLARRADGYQDTSTYLGGRHFGYYLGAHISVDKGENHSRRQASS